MNSLRARLFGAIALTVAICVALTVVVGVVLTRRAVDRGALRDLSHQADLIAGAQRIELSPLTHLPQLARYFRLQHEGYHVTTAGLPGSVSVVGKEVSRGRAITPRHTTARGPEVLTAVGFH